MATYWWEQIGSRQLLDLRSPTIPRRRYLIKALCSRYGMFGRLCGGTEARTGCLTSSVRGKRSTREPRSPRAAETRLAGPATPSPHSHAPSICTPATTRVTARLRCRNPCHRLRLLQRCFYSPMRCRKARERRAAAQKRADAEADSQRLARERELDWRTPNRRKRANHHDGAGLHQRLGGRPRRSAGRWNPGVDRVGVLARRHEARAGSSQACPPTSPAVDTGGCCE